MTDHISIGLLIRNWLLRYTSNEVQTPKASAYCYANQGFLGGGGGGDFVPPLESVEY